MYDILSLPPSLPDLRDVPPELENFYDLDDAGVFVLTETACANIAKVADGIQELAEQRDQAASTAQAALVDAQVMGAILLSGAAGQLAAAAAALFSAENKIVNRDGHLVVETGGGDVPLKDAVAAFVASAEGAVFLSARPAENADHFLRQMRRALTS